MGKEVEDAGSTLKFLVMSVMAGVSAGLALLFWKQGDKEDKGTIVSERTASQDAVRREAGLEGSSTASELIPAQPNGSTPRTSSQPSLQEEGARASKETPAGMPAKVGMTGSLPDMSAMMAAKVAVSNSQQADPEQMRRVYEDMARSFREGGLNTAAIAAQGQYYGGLEGGWLFPWPLEYKKFPTPLLPGAVRLVVLLLESHPRLVTLASAATKAIAQLLPPGFKMHPSAPSNFHVTVFMTSQPHDPRPDPFVPGGGLDRSAPPNPIPGPDPHTLQRELDAFASLAAESVSPEMEVDRVLMANSGTLLLCMVDGSGRLAALRQRCLQEFPGAAVKQPTIMHVTLGRILTPSRLPAETVAAVCAECDKLTSRMRGMRFEPRELWHIQEEQFTTVNGSRERFKFGSKVGGESA